MLRRLLLSCVVVKFAMNYKLNPEYERTVNIDPTNVKEEVADEVDDDDETTMMKMTKTVTRTSRWRIIDLLSLFPPLSLRHAFLIASTAFLVRSWRSACLWRFGLDDLIFFSMAQKRTGQFCVLPFFFPHQIPTIQQVPRFLFDQFHIITKLESSSPDAD